MRRSRVLSAAVVTVAAGVLGVASHVAGAFTVAPASAESHAAQRVARPQVLPVLTVDDLGWVTRFWCPDDQIPGSRFLPVPLWGVWPVLDSGRGKGKCAGGAPSAR